MPEAEKVPDQIPWAERTKVTDQSDFSVGLELPGKMTADIFHRDFEWSVLMNSKIDIDGYMKKDGRLTQDIQEYFENFESKSKEEGPYTFKDKIMSWLKYGPVGEIFLPRTGPKEWRPPLKGRRKRTKPWKLDTYGYGNTYNEDSAYYWGDVFEFAHFKTDEGDEGAVILWQGGGDPRGNYHLPMVYMGDFEEFLDSQYEREPWSVETFLNWNSTFENGFMWAWEKIGVFDDPDEHILRYDDRHVKQVLKAIEKEPSILLPESVQKVLLQFDEFPTQIQKAVTWLMNNRRRELEKALGQKLIWGDLYAE